MGVLTSVHQVPLPVLKRFRSKPSTLDFLMYEDTIDAETLGMPKAWRPATVGFDKEWEDLCTILRQLGYRRAGSILEYRGTGLSHPGGAFVRYWRKTKLKTIDRDLGESTAATLTAKAASVEDLTDWNGDPAHHLLDYYLQSFDELRALIRSAIAAEEALVAVSC